MANNCLCCQKPLKGIDRYHSRCLIRLFGISRLPTIPFRVEDMPGLVAKDEGHVSISGVQKKLSVRLNKESTAMESVATGGTHILKPEPDRFPFIPQNENHCMNMAEELGFTVPPHGLFDLADGKPAYVVKRFDRTDDGEKLHKETMFQVLGAKEKYSGSLEMIGKEIRNHTANVGLDTIEFFERVLFCFLTGNGDMHLKNWAFLFRHKTIALAPCYDLVCSKIYFAKEEDSALSVNARKNRLKRTDFETFSNYLKIDPKAAANSFDKLRLAQDRMLAMTANSELPLDLQHKLADVIKTRCKQLFGGSAA